MRTNMIGLVAVVGLWLTAAVPALAHHSFAAEFDADKPFKMTGGSVGTDWTYIFGDSKC